MKALIKKILTAWVNRSSLFRRLESLKRKTMWDAYTQDALALAHWVDCDRAMLTRRQQHPERLAPTWSDRSCNWYLPVFDNAFYGGIMTILRLASHLNSKDGVAQRFIICGECDPKAIKHKIAEAFPSLANSAVHSLGPRFKLDNVPPADYSIATLWTTAYTVLKVQNTGLKFYMIQDYEPLFYPAGSTYGQAELSYRFGFYGIANTVSLRDIYTRDFGGRAIALKPCIDTRIFAPGKTLSTDGPLRLFYYARPGTPRNAFELAVTALKLVKKSLGERVEILCAGSSWNPEDYGLAGMVQSIGMLPYEETGDLYRSCHVGLALMFTKHPSYLPFEMMGCGTLVVANHNTANTWLLKDRENCLLAHPTATCLADTLVEALIGYEGFAPLRQAASELIASEHSDWDSTLAGVAKFIHSPESPNES